MDITPARRRLRLNATVIVILALSIAVSLPSSVLAQTSVTQPEQAQASDAESSRLFFGPTARSVPAGQGYVGVWEVLIPMGQVGVTDRISIGGGAFPWMAINGDSALILVTPKLQVYRGGGTSVAVGALAGIVPGESSGAIPFFVWTGGGSDAAVTAAFFGPSFDHDLKPGLVMIGVEKRVSARTRFISENWIFGAANAGVVSGGVRISGKHISTDLGLGGLWDDRGFVVPMLIINAVYRF